MGRGFYCLPEPRIWRGRSRVDRPSGPDPYGPTSPGHAERNAVTVKTICHGMTREDLGHPIGASPSPSVAVERARPEPNPLPATDLASLSDRTAPPRAWRDDYGLRKAK
jgi:DNA-binding XRE family transcriptional regulator